jgi:hypothetical protein
MGGKLLIRRYRGFCNFSGKLPVEAGNTFTKCVWRKDDSAAIGSGAKRPIEQGQRWRHFNIEARDRGKASVTTMVRARDLSDSQRRILMYYVVSGWL